MNIIQDNSCTFCSESEETLAHLLFNCITVTRLWETVKTWLRTNHQTPPPITQDIVILGYTVRDPNYFPFNTLIVTKNYIFWASQKQVALNIAYMQRRFYDTYSQQKKIAQNKFKIESFEKQC